MSARGAFFWGSLGGLLPVLANLLVIDIAPIIDHLNTLTFGNYVGFGTRVFVLILLGGIFGAVNTDVRKPLALIQLGIAAPALVTAYVNAKPAKTDITMISIVSTAYAENVFPPKVQIAENFLKDFSDGFGTRLDKLDQMNRAKVYPNLNADSQATGTYCITEQGKFGPGPSNPVGSPCVIQSPGGSLTGRVGQ